MAITTTQYPSIISPSYSPMFYMNTSNYSSETGFKYQYDLYDRNGLIASKKVYPFPNDYGRIDVSTLLKNYLTYDLSYNITGSTDTTSSLMEYDLFIGHTGSTNTLAPSTSGIKFAFNGVDNDLTFNYKHYLLDGVTKKCLTSSPQTINVFLNDYYTLSFFNGKFGSEYSNVNYIYIKIYGSSIKNYRLTNGNYRVDPGVTLVNVDNMLKTVGIGPRNLNSSTLYNVDTTSNETGIFIDTGTTYYEVWMTDNSSTRTSLIYRFNVNQNVGRYDNAQIAFLNRLGNFSYFTFVGKTLQTTKVTPVTFLKNRYYQNGNTWITDISQRGTSVYNSNYTTEYTFTSDYINQATFTFMEELFTSPEVYYITELGALPMIITDTDWVNKRTINDKVINFSLKCSVANSKKTNI